MSDFWERDKETTARVKDFMRSRKMAWATYTILKKPREFTVRETKKLRKQYAEEWKTNCEYEPMGMSRWLNDKKGWIDLQIEKERNSAACNGSIQRVLFDGHNNQLILEQTESLPGFLDWWGEEAFDMAGVKPTKNVVKIEELKKLQAIWK